MKRALHWVALVGIGVSALLLAEYLSPFPMFCGEGGGCETVRQSAYASFVGIPTPALGIGFFASVMLLSLMAGARARKALTVVGGLGGLAGVGFIALQAMDIGAWCAYCLVADISAIAIAGLAFACRRVTAAPPTSRARLAYGGAAILACVAGFLAPRLAVLTDEQPGVVFGKAPEFVRAHRTPGKLTIVEFIDFQCGACRAQSTRFAEALADYGDRVELVYRYAPLARHMHATDAARAACCAEEAGKGEQMASELFRATDLTPAGCEC